MSTALGLITRQATWDVLSAYGASVSKVAAWAVVSAMVFRRSPEAFAVVVLVRATLGLLTYTGLGLGPAVIRLFHRVEAETIPPADPAGAGVPVDAAGRPVLPPVDSSTPPVLAYARRQWPRRFPPATLLRVRVATNACVATLITTALGAALLAAYALNVHRLHNVPALWAPQVTMFATLMGVGLLFRLASDAASGLLQAQGRITLDNSLAAGTDVLWALLTGWSLLNTSTRDLLYGVGVPFLIASLLLFMGRYYAVTRTLPLRYYAIGFVEKRRVLTLLAFGGWVTVAQAADFLYAPVDYLVLNRMVSPGSVAVYAPAVQIDSALLLIGGGLSATLLPYAARWQAMGNRAAARRAYVWGTLVTAAALTVAAVVTWLLSPWLLRVWLGEPLPGTRAVLTGVLVHTVIGGSSGVGRAILIGTGHVRAYAAAVLIGGAANAGISVLLVWMGWGVWGVITGTVVSVFGRCVVWMPWYVTRVLGEPGEIAESVTPRSRVSTAVTN